MRALITILLLSGALTFQSNAQKYRAIDKSPIDVAYYPDYFAHDRKDVDEIVARVIYGRPQKKDREVFGGLVEYGKVWRTGANESTEIQFYRDVTFGGEQLAAGTYSLFTIPGKDKWTVIINRDILYWGAYSYNEANDVLRVQVETSKTDKILEDFSIAFAGKDNDFSLYIGWDETQIAVPVSY